MGQFNKSYQDDETTPLPTSHVSFQNSPGPHAQYDVYQMESIMSPRKILGNGILCLLVVTLAGVGAFVLGNFFVDMSSSIPSVDKLACSRESNTFVSAKYHPDTHEPADYWKACYFAYECCTSIAAKCLNSDAKEYGAAADPYELCDSCMQEYAQQSLTVECEVDIDSDRRTSQDVIDDEDCWEESQEVDKKQFANTCQIDTKWCLQECTVGFLNKGKDILCKYCLNVQNRARPT